MLALMLYGLGHVLHLNQDLSQPEHVRNDQHVEPQVIEAYGREILAKSAASVAVHDQWFPLRPHGWTYWREAGFIKLVHFWDRGLYIGTSQALNNDAAEVAGAKLGLAEFSNGNFIGEDATYAEYFTLGTIAFSLHYFPFPSRLTGTTYPTITAQIQSGHVAPRDYADGVQRNPEVHFFIVRNRVAGRNDEQEIRIGQNTSGTERYISQGGS